MRADIKELALKALEEAKVDLRRDGYLIPVALMVTKEGVADFTLDFDDVEQKSAAYARLVAIAKEREARAIITINDATVNGVPTTPRNRGDSSLPDTQSQYCIFVTASGPTITTWSVVLPYYRHGTHVEFGQPNAQFGDHLPLLSGWALEPERRS